MNHSVRACVKNTAKTAIVSLMIILTACSTISGNNTNASSDKKMVCGLSAATICENSNYNSDNFNAEILANNKDSNGNNSAGESSLGHKIVGYTALGLAIVFYTGLLIFDHNFTHIHHVAKRDDKTLFRLAHRLRIRIRAKRP